MSTKTKAPTALKVANEASYQLACDKEFAGWMVTLMKAIQLDREHEDGRNIEGLVDLGQYLAETHFADTERALDAVNAGLNAIGGEA